MPLRHVVMFQWAADVNPDHVERVRAGFDALRSQIPASAVSTTGTTSASPRATSTTC